MANSNTSDQRDAKARAWYTRARCLLLGGGEMGPKGRARIICVRVRGKIASYSAGRLCKSFRCTNINHRIKLMCRFGCGSMVWTNSAAFFSLSPFCILAGIHFAPWLQFLRILIGICRLVFRGSGFLLLLLCRIASQFYLWRWRMIEIFIWWRGFMCVCVCVWLEENALIWGIDRIRDFFSGNPKKHFFLQKDPSKGVPLFSTKKN